MVFYKDCCNAYLFEFFVYVTFYRYRTSCKDTFEYVSAILANNGQIFKILFAHGCNPSSLLREYLKEVGNDRKKIPRYILKEWDEENEKREKGNKDI